MTSLYKITIEAAGGEDIGAVAELMTELAGKYRCEVLCDFNGTQLVCHQTWAAHVVEDFAKRRGDK